MRSQGKDRVRNEIIYNDLEWTFPFGGIRSLSSLSHKKKNQQLFLYVGRMNVMLVIDENISVVLSEIFVKPFFTPWIIN